MTSDIQTSLESPAKETPAEAKPAAKPGVPEIGGRKGPEPTRYGDWEHGGKCVDF